MLCADAVKMCDELMNIHMNNNDSRSLYYGWRFKWMNGSRTFGQCSYRNRTIALSKKLVALNDESIVRNTILHEIAHALAPGQHHNHLWKKVARRIGCTGDRCYSSSEVIAPKAPYELHCENCGHVSPRYKRTRSALACGKCCKKYNYGVYTPKYLLKFRRAA